jgi:formate dehydrogenase major subunit
MVDAIHEGKLRAMYLAGEDMISADSNANHLAGAFENWICWSYKTSSLPRRVVRRGVILPGAPSL